MKVTWIGAKDATRMGAKDESDSNGCERWKDATRMALKLKATRMGANAAKDTTRMARKMNASLIIAKHRSESDRRKRWKRLGWVWWKLLRWARRTQLLLAHICLPEPVIQHYRQSPSTEQLFCNCDRTESEQESDTRSKSSTYLILRITIDENYHEMSRWSDNPELRWQLSFDLQLDLQLSLKHRLVWHSL